MIQPDPTLRGDPIEGDAEDRALRPQKLEEFIGQAEARLVDGRVEGLVLIWPVMDEADQPRVAAELIDSDATSDLRAALRALGRTLASRRMPASVSAMTIPEAPMRTAV